MPDAQGNPTDTEVISALGWTPAAPEDAAPPVDTDAAPAATEVAPAAAVQAAPPVAGAPAAVAAAPVAVAPTPAPVPVATPVPAPQPDHFQQAQLAELNQLRQQGEINRINQQALAFKNARIAQGWDDAHAHEAATLYAQTEFQSYQHRETQRVANEQAKVAKAYELSQKYGAPVEHLKAYNDPLGMEQAARLYQETTGRINALQAQVNQANKAPVQTFDSNRMTASRSPTSMRLRYATDPNYNPSDAELAQMGLS